MLSTRPASCCACSQLRFCRTPCSPGASTPLSHGKKHAGRGRGVGCGVRAAPSQRPEGAAGRLQRGRPQGAKQLHRARRGRHALTAPDVRSARGSACCGWSGCRCCSRSRRYRRIGRSWRCVACCSCGAHVRAARATKLLGRAQQGLLDPHALRAQSALPLHLCGRVRAAVFEVWPRVDAPAQPNRDEKEDKLCLSAYNISRGWKTA